MNIRAADHQRLIDALQKQLQVEVTSGPIKRIETHISSVLLSGNYAYKIKKPINLGFLDFSTLAKRKHFCEEEIRLNGRAAPGIYLSVVAITGSLEQPRIDGDGAIIEYAVKMRRFTQSGLLGKLLGRGELSDKIIDELAGVIADFHRDASIAPHNSDFGNAKSVFTPVLQNIKIIRPLLNDLREQQQLDRIEAWSSTEYRRLQNIFARRKENGFIRECHGDLHLGNIAQIDGVVTLFDGIEFNEQLHWIDVISDLAFTSMDLIDHGATAFAWRLINRYLERSGDYEGLEVLRFYQVYRAMVRAKVACIRLGQDDITNQERSDALQQYRDYAALAEQFTAPHSPLLMLTCGLSGSGKSWLSQQLLEALPACRIRSDVERKRLFSPLHADTQKINTGLYSTETTTKTYQQLLTLAKQILASGYSTIVDAAFLQKIQRSPFQTLAKQHRYPVSVLHTHASSDILKERILRRQSESDNVSDASLKVLKIQQTAIEKPTATENTIEIDTRKPIKIDTLIKKLRVIE
jgi:aminoglycoside phosphotransferase family enzyme/gluconate kinase